MGRVEVEQSIPDSDDSPELSLAPASPPQPRLVDDPTMIHQTQRTATSSVVSSPGRSAKRIKLDHQLAHSHGHPVEDGLAAGPLRDLPAFNAPILNTNVCDQQEDGIPASKIPQVSPTRRKTRVSPAKAETERLGGMTASQDFAWMQSANLDFFDIQPSSDPGQEPTMSSPIRSPPPRPAKRASPSSAHATSVGCPVVHAVNQLADDSGVFIIDADKIDLELDPDLAIPEEEGVGGVDENEMLLTLGHEKPVAPPLKSDEFDDGDDSMWDAFTSADFDSLDTLASDRKGKVRLEEQDDAAIDQEVDPGVDAFDVGLAAAAGWDPTKTGVFQLASKKTVQLSAEALKKAAALFENISDDPVLLSQAGQSENTAAEDAGPPDSTPKGVRADNPAQATPMVPSTPSSQRAHTGRSVIDTASALRRSPTTSRVVEDTCSEQAMARAIADFDQIPSSPQRPRPVLAMHTMSGFKTAAGTAVAAPSQAALARARGTLLSSPSEAGSGHRTSTLAAGASNTLQTSPAPVLDDVFMTQPASSLGGIFAARGAPAAAGSDVLSPSSNATNLPSTVATPDPARSDPVKPQPRPPPPSSSYTAFRSPMLSRTSMTSTPATFATTPVKQPSGAQNRAQLLSTGSKPVPAPVRRLNLGMGPRARLPPGTPGAVVRPMQQRFHTPFKNGKRPEGLTPMGLKSSANQTASVKESPASKAVQEQVQEVKVRMKSRTVQRPQADWTPIFHLDATGERHSLQLFGLRPMSQFYETLLQQGIPREVLDMDATSAKDFVFQCGRGPVQAFEALVSVLGGPQHCHVSQKWISNHWTLVVWKLACYVRSKPELLNYLWLWDAAVNQIKYRYEREINRAERSCIKRIQEQDSPASLPMVLCVSALRWDELSDEASDATGTAARSMVISGLELTDGWYRIRSNIDKTLRSACQRGKIVVGTKLAISGAKVDSSREGRDVLEALGRSSLIISGNSTALSPWYSRLGLIGHSPIATLASLTSDGGPAALLDLHVERVFPYGYIDMGKNSSHGMWNEEEEHTRAEEWKRGRAKAEAKMLDELDKAENEWDVILDLLRDAASVTELVPTGLPESTSGQEEPDEMLDRLENSSDKAAVVRRLNAGQIHATLSLAGQRSLEANQQAAADLEKELATKYPPRDVRGFCVVRVRDARVQKQNLKEARTALLTVWDAKLLGEGFFQTGKRYMVTNVMPKGGWRRQTRELTLTTRRDSRWTCME